MSIAPRASNWQVQSLLRPAWTAGRVALHQEAGAARLRRHGHILRVLRVPFDDFVSLASMWQT